jgi:hypothetical protein
MRWKSWILASLTFAIVCLFADWSFTRWIIVRSPFSDAGRIQHLYAENDGEIPIFGTSKAHGHYDPAAMGLNAFNYGLDQASFEITEMLLQIELAKPKTTPVIIELQYNDTASLGDRSTLLPFVSDPRFRRLLERFHEMEWRYYLPAFRYFGYYDIYFKDLVNEHLHVKKVNRGFSELVHPPPFDRAKLDAYIRERLNNPTVYSPNEDWNRRFIALINAHPQRLFFLVISPYHPSYFAHFQNADKFNTFEEKLAAMPNVVVIDRGRESYPDEEFLDTLHLRREGATEFSRRMGDTIRQILRDRNGTEAGENAGAK